MLDEPTVGLDPVLRRDLWTLFRRFAGEGTTLLVSSHVMDEAARCDRLLLMREGRLLADDTLDGVLAATGTADVEQAFLALVDRATASTGPTEAGAGVSARLTLATAAASCARSGTTRARWACSSSSPACSSGCSRGSTARPPCST